MQIEHSADPGPVLISVKDAAASLSIGQTKTWALIKDGHLKTTRIGGRTLVRADSLRALAEQGA
ncbi:MAG: helix-turn-helix domain-containing protein [Rhodospirillales bacterium]